MTFGEAVMHRVIAQVVDLAFFALVYLTVRAAWDVPLEVAVGVAVVVALSTPVQR